VADSLPAYVALATGLAADPAYRQAVRNEIQARCHDLFEDFTEVRALEQFLREAVH
jgi:predicted O-linked N-acetylglucosamine transferase (SPINDLY family)